jgi:hypothetical protein
MRLSSKSASRAMTMAKATEAKHQSCQAAGVRFKEKGMGKIQGSKGELMKRNPGELPGFLRT